MIATDTINTYRCVACTNELRAAFWCGRCPTCGSVNTMRLASVVNVEVKSTTKRPRRPPPPPRRRVAGFGPPITRPSEPPPVHAPRAASEEGLPDDDEPEDLCDLPDEQIPRMLTEHRTIDDVFAHPLFGRGMPEYGAVMFAGAPGAGKSRLTLEIAARRAALNHRRVLVISGEEQKSQIGARSRELQLEQRFGLQRGQMSVYLTNDLDRAMRRIDNVEADDVFLDAMNVLRARRCPQSGDMAQLVFISRHIYDRAWASESSEYRGCKRVLFWAICHGTKDGNMAGPQKAKHLFDAAFMLDHAEVNGEPAVDQTTATGYIRMRSLAKNRFGASDAQCFMHMSKPRGILVPFQPITPRLET